MSVEPLSTRLHKGGKQQGHLLSALGLAVASMLSAFGALLQIAEKNWTHGLLCASFAVFMGYDAFVYYALSRKASGE